MHCHHTSPVLIPARPKFGNGAAFLYNKSMGVLRARKIESVPTLQGVQADIALIEPNGDEHRVRCLCKLDGSTDIGGDPDVIAFLNAKYGAREFCLAARKATFGPY